MSSHQPNLAEIEAQIEAALHEGEESALAYLFKAKDPRFTKQILTKLGPHFGQYTPTEDCVNGNCHFTLSAGSKYFLEEEAVKPLNRLVPSNTSNRGMMRHATVVGQGFKKSSMSQLYSSLSGIRSSFGEPLRAKIVATFVEPFYARIQVKFEDPRFSELYWKIVAVTRAAAHPNGFRYIPQWFQSLSAEKAAHKLANIEAYGTHSIPADGSEPEFHITVFYGQIPDNRRSAFVDTLESLIGKTIFFDGIDFKPQQPNGSIKDESLSFLTEGGAAAV
jgi:hypothetical protein